MYRSNVEADLTIEKQWRTSLQVRMCVIHTRLIYTPSLLMLYKQKVCPSFSDFVKPGACRPAHTWFLRIASVNAV